MPYPGGGVPAQFTNAPATGNKDLSASPDGNTVAFANNSLTPTYQIYTTDSDGTTGSATRFTNSSGNDTNPSFNPNGTPIVSHAGEGYSRYWREHAHIRPHKVSAAPAINVVECFVP